MMANSKKKYSQQQQHKKCLLLLLKEYHLHLNRRMVGLAWHDQKMTNDDGANLAQTSTPHNTNS